MASEIPEIVYAFDPQLKFMEVGILLTYFAVSCSSLSEDSAEFRYVQYVPLYIADLTCDHTLPPLYSDAEKKHV